MTEQAKRKESKEVTREEIDNLEAFVRKLEAKVARMSENWKTFCKSHLGSEANDGKIGGARLNFVTAIALVLVCAGIVAATQSYTSGDLAHWGKVKITSDGTYSTDGGIIASGAMTISNGVTVTQKLIVGCYTNSALVAHTPVRPRFAQHDTAGNTNSILEKLFLFDAQIQFRVGGLVYTNKDLKAVILFNNDRER